MDFVKIGTVSMAFASSTLQILGKVVINMILTLILLVCVVALFVPLIYVAVLKQSEYPFQRLLGLVNAIKRTPTGASQRRPSLASGTVRGHDGEAGGGTH